jgi:DsbC/DsbD-like thiol-disulfide interchange protein
LAQQNKLVVAPPDPVEVKPGATIEAHLHVATIPGFHVNSNTPSQDYLIPLRLTWAAGPLQTTAIHYPKPETMNMGADKLSVFSGSFEITTTFAAPKYAKPGSTAMTGQLHYQACNNRMCFRPMTIDVRIPVTIE